MLADYQCKICGASYGLGSLLNAHISNAHGIPTDMYTAPVEFATKEQVAETSRLLRGIIYELEKRIIALEAENESLKAGK